MTDPLIGESIGRYRILGQLGRGGMATVYKAYDSSLEREVAIKVIRREAFSPEVADHILKRFEREAKSLARLSHPHIVKVYDYGEHEGSPYLVMEFITGGALVPLPDRPMPFQDAARLLAPIARALEYAHEKHIIHRDIKPMNILLTSKGHPLLTDFGIAKLLEGKDNVSLTSSGMGIGTPEYMAPEQGLGNRVDHRADIYALGSVFYELITGHKPFMGETPMAVVIKHIYDPLPRPRLDIDDLPNEVELAIFKAMAKKASDRYQLMGEFAEVLENLAQFPSDKNDDHFPHNGPDRQIPSPDEKTAAAHIPAKMTSPALDSDHEIPVQSPTKLIELSAPTLETITAKEDPASPLPAQAEASLRRDTLPRRKNPGKNINLAKRVNKASIALFSILIPLLAILFAVSWTLGQAVETSVGLSPIVLEGPEQQSINEMQMDTLIANFIEPYQRWVQAGSVDLLSPDRMILTLFTSVGSFQVELQVSRNEMGFPQYNVIKTANLPVLVFAIPISNGINRGIAHSLDQAGVRMVEFSISDGEIIYRVEPLK